MTGNISGDQLDIDNIRIVGNTITTTDADGNLTLSTNGTGSVLINESITLGDATTETITVNARFASHLLPNVDDERDLGSTDYEWRNLFMDGIARIDDLRADTANIGGGTIDDVTIGGATAGAGTFTEVDVDNVRINGSSILTTTTDQNLTLNPNGTGDVVISADLDLNGNLDVSGNTTLGNADTDTITANAKFATSLIPNSATRDLGSSADEWRNLFITGIARIDDLRADTVDIDDGNIDNTVIGLNTPAFGSFTSVDVGSKGRLEYNSSTSSLRILTFSSSNDNINLLPDGSGRVIVGTTSAAKKLDVTGDLDVDGATTLDGTTVNGTLTVSGQADVDNIRINGSTISRINSTNGSITILPQGSGDVVIGDGTDNDLNVKGDVVAFHTSDITLKLSLIHI